MENTSTLSPVKQTLLQRRLQKVSRALVRRPEIPLRPNRDSAPLSFSQRQMWVIDQMMPGNPAYNLPYGFRLRGPLDCTALEASFNEVIQRHESLRTTFAIKDGEPLQLIQPDLKIKINLTNLDHLTREERENRLQALASEESIKSFDLSCLPLIRVSLFKLAETEHVLLVNLHHIIADGLSIGVLLSELDAFYRAKTGGGDPSPPELSVQYGDFALWQRNVVADETTCARQLEFWRKQLSGTLPVLELPGDRPRPARQSFKGSNVSFTLPVEQVRDLRSLAAREEGTLFMIFLAAFQVLLQKYAGAEDMVIGMPVASRTCREVEPLIGNFLNMVALRCDLSGNPTLIEVLRKSRDTTLNACSNSDLPLEGMMNYLKFERDPSRNSIFQVALQVLSSTTPALGDLEVSSFEFDLKFAQFDLSLHFYEEAEGYRGRFEYCTDLFKAQTIRRLCGHYLTLLEAFVHEPDRRISTLTMLTEAERRQVLEVWNQTAVAYPAPRCVHELVEEQARIRPQALAAESQGRQLTYRELDERAESLAGRLRNHGVQADSLVAIYLERSIEMLVGLLAVWKAGGAYVPIDPEYPADRVRFMLEDTKAVAVLTQKALAGALPAVDATVVHLDAEEDRVAADAGDHHRRSANSPERLAYLIYTSGSTGRPKGVPIKHSSLFNLICWHQQAYQVTPADRASQIAGTAFDASVWEIWPYLSAGASIHFPDHDTRLDGGQLVRWLADQHITLTFLPTPLAESALRESWPQTSALRVLLTGGDRLTYRPARKLPFRLVNHYGPTENTVVSTCADVDECPGHAAPPIGRPLPNTQFYVVDRHLQPAPIGVPGELLLGGVQLTPGYWNRPELTAERFIPNPFGAEPGARLYRTGDLVRLLPDGNLEFLGRIDNQVKLRGFRIELGEIESALSQHPAVWEAVVLAREDAPGEKILVAYLVAKNPPADLVDQLREWVRAAMPEYMVPAHFVLLKALPRTHNGKLDREALPPPSVGSASPRRAAVAPRTPSEEWVLGVFRDVLDRSDFGVFDSFFDLGGHSLMAARLMFRLRAVSGFDLPLRQLFERPTVAGLAEAVDGLSWLEKSKTPSRNRGAHRREDIEM
jgi:amino acid adenylation domain-containing protein